MFLRKSINEGGIPFEIKNSKPTRELKKALKEAKKIEFDCQRIMNEAKSKSEAIIRKAEERAAQIVSQEAIVVEAKKKAVDMITKAQQTAQNIQKTAMASLTKMLTETESFYTKNLQEIKSVKSRLSASKK